MHIAVPVKMVPDLVEELAIDASGTAIDTAWLRLIVNESDDHAIEQAILLKERHGGQVAVLAPDAEGVDDLLFTAAARGADRLVKLTGDLQAGANNHALARQLAAVLAEGRPDLVLTGVQAHNDLDGWLGPLLAEYMGMPYVGGVAGVAAAGANLTVRKEYPGGLLAEMAVVPPAVLGIQAADQPPRYVAISKVRQMMKSVSIEELELAGLDPSGGPVVDRMFLPEAAERATMLEGDADEIAGRLVDVLKAAGAL